MSVSVIIIGTLLVAMFVLPFFLVGIGKNNNQKQFKTILANLAEEHSCKITQSEFWTDSAIGLDEATNDLFYVHSYSGKPMGQHINLSRYKGCKVNNYSRHVKDNLGNHTAIDRLELELTPLEKGKSHLILEFFSADGSKLFSNEFEVVEKWSKLINEKISNIKG